MLLTRYIAEQALEQAQLSNPGPWVDHSRYVALACENIARHCPDLNAEDAYIYGLLHDIGRYAGVTLRYGVHPDTVRHWQTTLDIKAHFELISGRSIYDLLPGVAENTFQWGK